MKSRQPKLARRDFLQAGIVATFGCFSAAELKAARAAAQVSRKAVLTRDSLMGRIPAATQKAERQALSTQLNKGIANYLEENFELTETQKQNVRALPAGMLQELQQGIQKALANNLTIEIQDLQQMLEGGVISNPQMTRANPNLRGKGCQIQTRNTPTSFIIQVGKAE